MSNMQSASENASVVQAYLDVEVALNRIIGPVPLHMAPVGTQLSPFGVIPKPNQPGKWRLILNLSAPQGKSVNDGIESELCSLQYLRLDEVVKQISSWGTGTLLAKMDVESAYRIVPAHPKDRLLLGMQWNGGIWFDTRLPFGLRSAPMIFTALADALQWSFSQNGVTWVRHYLDNFITIGHAGSQECQQNLEIMLDSCRSLGVPTAPAKCEGPTTRLIFLGYELDTILGVVRLPAEKLARTLALVKDWSSRRSCKRKQLESLLGHLQHAATVVRPGRTFVRRLIELLSVARRKDRWVRLSATTRSDLVWWETFLQGWNGISMIPRFSLPGIVVESDASGSWGCGARWGSQWLQWQWVEEATHWHIAPKELLPILFAVAVWGQHWRGRLVHCRCDNMAVVSVVNSGYARDTTLMHMLRCLFFLVSHYQVTVQASHIPGIENHAAMRYHVTISLDSCRWFLEHVNSQHTFHISWWNSWFYLNQIGPHHAGPSYSQTTAGRLSTNHTTVIFCRKKEILTILPTHRNTTIDSNRVWSAVICSFCSKSGFETPNSQMLSIGNSSPSNLQWGWGPRDGQNAPAGTSITRG